MSIRIENGLNHLEEVKSLIIEYTQSLNRDLSFQSFKQELSDLSLKYGHDQGELLCALNAENEVIGCVAYHKHSDERCEMKRLFVKPDYRKEHAGDALVNAIIEHARLAGFKEMVLDTIEPFKAAIHLYHKYGFYEIEAYYYNPMDDVIYMKKNL